jgi:hypothetical protein
LLETLAVKTPLPSKLGKHDEDLTWRNAVCANNLNLWLGS